MRPGACGIEALTLVAAFGCGPAERPLVRDPPRRLAPTTAAVAVPEIVAVAPAAVVPTPEPEPPPPVESPGFVALEIPGDAPIAVAHGPAGSTGAIVYLHGACGDPKAPAAWSNAAAEHGTVVSIRGDRPCGKNGRFYWGPDTKRLHTRVRAALGAVVEARGAAFDDAHLVLMGYSQGATRAQALHALHPDGYPRIILAGMPVPPSARRLASARAVAVLGGQLEHTTPMRAGVWALETRQIPVRFDLFPSAAHGDFGPEAERVMRDALGWLLAQP